MPDINVLSMLLEVYGKATLLINRTLTPPKDTEPSSESLVIEMVRQLMDIVDSASALSNSEVTDSVCKAIDYVRRVVRLIHINKIDGGLILADVKAWLQKQKEVSDSELSRMHGDFRSLLDEVFTL